MYKTKFNAYTNNDSFLITVALYICTDFAIIRLFTQASICPSLTTAFTKAGKTK